MFKTILYLWDKGMYRTLGFARLFKKSKLHNRFCTQTDIKKTILFYYLSSAN